jgi:hypothetical protein
MNNNLVKPYKLPAMNRGRKKHLEEVIEEWFRTFKCHIEEAKQERDEKMSRWNRRDKDSKDDIAPEMKEKESKRLEITRSEMSKKVFLFTDTITSIEDFHQAFPNVTNFELINGYKEIIKMNHLLAHWTLQGPEGKPYFNKLVNQALVESIVSKGQLVLDQMAADNTQRKSEFGKEMLSVMEDFIEACMWLVRHDLTPMEADINLQCI